MEWKKKDTLTFFKELISPWRVILFLLFIGFGTMTESFQGILLYGFLGLIINTVSAYRAMDRKRFANRKFKAIWEACKDRVTRLNRALKALNKDNSIELVEIPVTVNRTSDGVYDALRRADLVLTEIVVSEGWLRTGLDAEARQIPRDRQSQEMYRIADKNVAEYNQHYGHVVALIERAEAQAAVFLTTLDSLRIRVLGHRLKTRRDTGSLEFLQSISEAKMQLDSIDKALEEIELTPFPTTIAIDPAGHKDGLAAPDVSEHLEEILSRANWDESEPLNAPPPIYRHRSHEDLTELRKNDPRAAAEEELRDNS